MPRKEDLKIRPPHDLNNLDPLRLTPMNPPEQIESLANKRSGGVASLYISWRQSLAAFPPLPPDVLQTLVMALPSPAASRHLAVYLSRETDPQQAVIDFLKAVDESDEDLKDWLAAFSVFANFIDSTAHRPNLTTAAGYLHCCEAIIQSGARYATFAQTAETMLSTYGYEGQTD
jgi:hypothetical protein